MDRYRVAAPLAGTVVAVTVSVGDTVRAGQELVIIESMKLEHVVSAEAAGVVLAVAARVGQTVEPGAPLAEVEPTSGAVEDSLVGADPAEEPGPDSALAEVRARHALGLDEANAPPERTSRISAIRAASSSTGRSRSPRNVAAGRSTT